MIQDLRRTNVSPVRALLCAALLACTVTLTFLQWNANKRVEEHRALRAGIPNVHSLDNCSIFAAEKINDSCHRYYVAVPPKALARMELLLPDRRVELGLIDASPNGRLFQVWIGLERSSKYSFLDFYCEEISLDGLEKLGPAPEGYFGQKGNRDLTVPFSSVEARLSDLPDTPTPLGAKVTLAYSQDLPIASIEMIGVAEAAK